MRISAVCGIAAASLLLPACATITRGTSQKFAIESVPAQADVALSTGQTCVTPCKFNLKRKHDFTATFKKQGYKTTTANVESKVRTGGVAGVAGNVLVGGIIGAAIDGSNGSMNDLTPNPLIVTLEPDQAVAAAPAPAAESIEVLSVSKPTGPEPDGAPAATPAPTGTEAAPATAASPATGTPGL
jgi:hypothetical protein